MKFNEFRDEIYKEAGEVYNEPLTMSSELDRELEIIYKSYEQKLAIKFGIDAIINESEYWEM